MVNWELHSGKGKDNREHVVKSNLNIKGSRPYDTYEMFSKGKSNDTEDRAVAASGWGGNRDLWQMGMRAVFRVMEIL